MNGPLTRQQWFTAEELAGLPGLPTTKRGVQLLIDREHWTSRERQARGGGREYHHVWLPQAAKQALLERAMRETLGDVQVQADPPTPPPAPHLGADEARARDARTSILDAIAARNSIGIGKAEEAFLAAAAAGELAPELQALIVVANARGKALSRRSLRRWRKELETRGADALAPRDSASRRRDRTPPWLYQFMKAYARPTKPSIGQIHEELQQELGLPTLRTVQREVSRLGAVARNRGRMGPRDLKRLRAFTVRTTEQLLPTDVYSADGHCADFEVQHPQHGKPFRPEIVTVIDIKTRVAVGWSAGLAESALLVADALRNACCGGGIPTIFYVDNGAGFVNEHMGHEATGLLARLGAAPRHSLPYNSQARGVIERAHASIWIRAGRALPAFVGHDMDREARQIAFKRGRADIEATDQSRVLMSWEAFIAWGHAQIAAYNDRPQGGLPRVRDGDGPLRPMTPNEAWAEALEDGWAPITPTAEEQTYLFRPHDLRVVDRGQVRINGSTYFARELDLGDWHGRTVQVAYDVQDPTRVWVKDEDGRFITVAERDANHAPYFPKNVIEMTRERRATARLKRLESRADEVRAEADEQPAVIEVAPRSAEEDRDHERLVARLAARKTPPPAAQSREDRWYADVQRMEGRIADGEAVSDEDRAWLQQMQATPWYAARENARRRHEALFKETAPADAAGA